MINTNAKQKTHDLPSAEAITQKRNAQLMLANEVGRLATSILDLNEMLDKVTRAIQTGFHYYNVALLLLDEDRREVVMEAATGGLEYLSASSYRQSIDEGIIGWVVRNGQSLLANDVSQEPHYIRISSQVPTQSELCVPLKLENRVIGALDVQSTQLNAFDQTDIMALEILAAQIASGIRNARLFEAERQARQLAETLRETTSIVSSTLELNQVLNLIVEQLQKVVAYDSSAIFLLRDERMEVVAGRGFPKMDEVMQLSVPLSMDTLLRQVVTTGKPLIIPDATQDPRFRGLAGTEYVRSWLGVPLISKNKVIGCMTIDNRQPDVYTDTDARLAQTFAIQAAIAIENAQLFAAEQVQRQRAEILRDVAQVVSSTLDLNSVLRLVLEQLKRILTYDTASIILFSKADPAMLALAGYEDEEAIIREAAIRLGDSRIFKEMTVTKQAVVIPDVREDDRWIWVPGAEHVRAWIGVPLLVRDEMIGALMIDSVHPGFYTAEDAELVQFLANQAAIAIENARLFEAEARRRQEAETLRQAAQAMSATLDLQEVFKLILDQLRLVVPYDSASIQLLKGDRLEIIGGLGFPNLDELLGLSFPLDGNNPNREVVNRRAPFIVDDAPTIYEGFLQEPHARARIRSWLGIPLLFGDKLIGMIALDRQEPHFYTEEHARLAMAFAAQAAIAIENARLYEELQANMRELQTILDHAPLSISLFDPEMKYLLTNKYAEQTEGLHLDEIRGKTCYEARGQARPCDECAGLLALKTGEVHHREGEIYPGYIVAETCVPIKNEAGDIRGILAIRQNVSEQRRLQTQLLQSGRLSAVGQLISGVAHELNNPLTSIMGYAELVQRSENVPPPIKADLQKIYEQAERSAHIVRKLLTFARQYAPMREKTDINRTIEQTIDLLAYQLKVDNITIVRDLDPHLPYTQADGHQLQQVFLNIINNAHHAMKQAHGRGTLTVRTQTVDNGQTIRISFSDDGPGIPENLITRIFDPFFTTKDVGEGTGLGLSICYGIVSEHGGRIWAESELGQGATFFVELPVVTGEQRAQASPEKTVVPVRPRGRPSRRILIVEDELSIAGLLSRILKLDGHITDLATDGQQALNRLRQAHYDAIICDLKMPGMSGQELYQRLMEMNSPLVKRMIFTTGDVINPETQAFLKETGRPCIKKPFLQEEVFRVLHEALEGESTQ